MTLAPVVALSHGGGPLPLLGDPASKDIAYSLKNRVSKILGLGTALAPRAILLITAHWSTQTPTISSGPSAHLYYDYGGFPPEAYSLQYPAPGAPDVAEQVREALDEQGLQPKMDATRGWDHGVFVPMLLVNPKADVPIVQMSVLDSEDPETHLRMGAALARLRAANIAIVGSGFASWHNIREMLPRNNPSQEYRQATIDASRVWNDALTEATLSKGTSERWDSLKRWREFPHAYKMHPRGGAEHFMPLLVCAGAAEDGEEGAEYKDDFLGVDIYTYYWGGSRVDRGYPPEGKSEL